MTTSADEFEQRLASDWPVESWQDLTVLLAVSGGPDSLALLRAMHALRPPHSAGRLIVAHANHQLRGSESMADAEFVRSLCEQLGLVCEVGVLDIVTNAARDGLEMAARNARYEFLSAAASRYGARYVATGHTADDQAETILHRILRGTGLSGLAGIPRVRPLSEMTTIIRPLLAVRRSDVLAYLTRLNQPYCIDLTNAESAFTRNRLRNELLPQLAREYNPAIVDALLRLGQLAGEAQSAVRALADQLRDDAVRRLPDGWHINAKAIAKAHPHLVREMLIQLWQAAGWPLQAMGFAEWQRLMAMLNSTASQPAKQILPGNVIAEWNAADRSLRLTAAT